METEFDAHADSYEAALGQGLALSGESRDYFALHRVRWLRHCLSLADASCSRVLDFGCGMGGAARHFLAELDVHAVVGVDTSLASLDVARRRLADGE